VPDDRHLRAYWSDRPRPSSRAADDVHRALLGLTALDGRRVPWRWERDDGATRVVESAAHCAEALDDGAVRWRAGGEERVSQQARFFVGVAGAARASLAVTLGVGTVRPAGLWVPERAELTLAGEPGGERPDVDEVASALGLLTAVFEADWAHAAVGTTPRAPLALHSDGAPVPGWLTWLGPRWASSLPALPPPATARPSGRGVLVVATAERFDPRRPAHVEHLRALTSALRDAASAGRGTPGP